MTFVIADDSIIVLVSSVLVLEGCHYFGDFLITIRFDPHCKCSNRVRPEFLTRCSSFNDQFEFSTNCTAKFKA